jgi:hypothetical protein
MDPKSSLVPARRRLIVVPVLVLDPGVLADTMNRLDSGRAPASRPSAFKMWCPRLKRPCGTGCTRGVPMPPSGNTLVV